MNWKLNCVLVVDDDEPTNFFTRTILEDSGIVNHVQVSTNAKEAIEYLKETNTDKHRLSPDLILLDINMPVMDGWEFLEEYKQMNQPSGKIILMITSELLPVDQEKVKNSHLISGTEYKPLTIEKLTNILRTHFNIGSDIFV